MGIGETIMGGGMERGETGRWGMKVSGGENMRGLFYQK